MNPLYPLFLKLDKINMLIVGAGEVGYEKLSFMVKSSPNANITILAEWISPAVEQLAARYPENIRFITKRFAAQDVVGYQLLVAATNFALVNKAVYTAAKQHKILINVADTPELCDFYLGSIVTKGNLKIAISTNGKSPTFAKRLRQLLEEHISDDVDQTLALLKEFRDRLGGDFENKVKQLNALTKNLLEDSSNAALN